jgi:hypothetical protein
MTRVPSEADVLFELRTMRNHAVILLVSVVDRRIVPALRFVSRMACRHSLALHISSDSEQTRRLAADWMDLGLTWLPLHMSDAGRQGVVASIREAIRAEVGDARDVTVVVPELELRTWWHPLLHRRRARRIAAALQSLPSVTAVIVPFSVERRNLSGDDDRLRHRP